jgi:hypothetical protein
MKRITLGAVLTVVMLLSSAVPVAGIVGGEPDGNRHPNVAMILAYGPGGGPFRCSATLVSPTVLVTAAHCTVDVVGKVLATFQPVAPVPFPLAPDDPGDHTSATGYTSAPAGWVAGTPHAHPLFDWELQLNDLHDVGVIVLDSPYALAVPAVLPPRNYLGGLANGKGGFSKHVFTLVGYGVFFQKPTDGPKKPVAISDVTRRFTDAVGQNLTSQVLKLAENHNDSRGGGGTCYGDSGGAAFHGGLLIGDTSFGGSQFCTGNGGIYRLDTDDARSFLDDFVVVP